MKITLSKIVIIMSLMLSIISSGCSSNINSIEEWGKIKLKGFKDNHYTTWFDHESEIPGHSFYYFYGEHITGLHNYSLEKIKKLKHASGINHFEILSKTNDFFVAEKDKKKFNNINEDFISRFCTEKIADYFDEERNDFYSETKQGALYVLNDGRIVFVFINEYVSDFINIHSGITIYE